MEGVGETGLIQGQWCGHYQAASEGFPQQTPIWVRPCPGGTEGDNAFLRPGADHSHILRFSTSGVWRDKDVDPLLQDSDERELGALDRGKSINKRQGAPSGVCVCSVSGNPEEGK